MRSAIFLLMLLGGFFSTVAQKPVHGEIRNGQTGEAVPGATILVTDSSLSVLSDIKGKFELAVPEGMGLVITATGFDNKKIYPQKEHIVVLLEPSLKEMDAVVVTGTMKPVRR